jgi:glycosyltransferase involved in cell wall biosynthesis
MRKGDRVVYVCQTFPWVTQAFTVREVATLLEHGVDVRVVAFKRPAGALIDESAGRLLPFTTYLPGRFGPALLGSFARMLVRHPLVTGRNVVFALLSRGCVATTATMRARALLAVARGAWIAEHCPDAAIFHAEFADEAATAAMVAGDLSGRPFSFKNHSSFNPMQLARKAHKAAFVATESEFTRDHYFAALPDDHVLVNRGGVELGEMRRRVEPDRTLRILCVGTLQEKKGHRFLIDALVRLRDDGVPFRCLIVGSGPLEDELVARVAGAGLGGSVAFRPYLVHGEVLSLYAVHDVVVLPAVVTETGDRDGLPAVLIEAGAAGCALVATPVSGIPELIVDGESGLLVPERDGEALAKALSRLAAEPELRIALGLGARRIVEERFDLHRNVEELAARFGSVLEPWARLDSNQGPRDYESPALTN